MKMATVGADGFWGKEPSPNVRGAEDLRQR